MVGLPLAAVLVKISSDVTEVCDVGLGLLVSDAVLDIPVGRLELVDDGLVDEEITGEPEEVVGEEDPERELKELKREVEF